MEPRPTLVCRLICTSTLLFTTCTLGPATQCAGADPEKGVADHGRVVARIDGKPIYEAQLKPELERNLQRFRRYGMRQDDDALLKRLQDRILDRVIGEQLIYRESRKLTIKDLDQRVEQELEALQTKYGTGERFEGYLQSKNMAMKELTESLTARICVAQYLKQMRISEPKIPESQIRATYQKNPADYTRKESVKVSHILVAVKDQADQQQRQEARNKAQKIRQEVLDGKDFAVLAAEHSDCNSASNGGNLDYVKRGYMPAEFDEVAFALEKDSVSQVVETQFGFHIIKVFDKRPATVAPYEEVREFIEKFLQQDASKKKLAAHIAELKSKAKIEILPNDA